MNELVLLTDKKAKFLIRFNLVMGIFHLLQGIAMLKLSKNFYLPIYTNFLNYNPITKSNIPQALKVFDVHIGYAIAAFLFLSAIAHFTLIMPGIRNWYLNQIRSHKNYGRWIEYSISSSLMIVIIALLCGVYDIGTLISLFSLNAFMNIFGLLMEKNYSKNKEVDWSSFAFGSIAGLIPWIIISIYFLGAAKNAGGIIPGFVYAILVSLFITFNIFALNMYLQYKKVGKWKDYVFGETAFITLSLIAKSLLAWQVFSGTLR